MTVRFANPATFFIVAVLLSMFCTNASFGDFAAILVEHSTPGGSGSGNPMDVLGPPDALAADFDQVDASTPGYVVVEFEQSFDNLVGDEVYIHLFDWTPGENEQFEVFASIDGSPSSFLSLGVSGPPIGGPNLPFVIGFDLSNAGLESARFVRIQNLIVDLAGDTEGPDIDAIQSVAPSVDVTRGLYISGDADSLMTSDNHDLVIQRLGTDTQSRTEFVIVDRSQTAVPSSLEVTLEGAVFARSPVVQTIELFNYATGAWELLDTRNATNMVDSTATVAATGDLSRFVDQITLTVEARIHFESTSPRQRFSSNTDQFIWMIGQ